MQWTEATHDDVIKWKHFWCYWPFVRGIHRSLMNGPHKGRWREDLMFSLICDWIYIWVNNREAGDSRRHRAHYDVIVMGFMNLWKAIQLSCILSYQIFWLKYLASLCLCLGLQMLQTSLLLSREGQTVIYPHPGPHMALYAEGGRSRTVVNKETGQPLKFGNS